ncbi:hypothetical protein, variant [Allomyces macrogynus ATCC 38327]|uniref:Uncharacterized protein n=1 Tax=Allomyces macrogynus (strain ATCC 38327) TaxID=578462 RepID=A0A0L0T177_ALLM3|nr:hypothetical protein, variant [Allomyces macrogynus ATCC 38327]|eukprot:KNE68354.1 hypothetical protein, variant [Allomyces macrogynus ATCC 38327]
MVPVQVVLERCHWPTDRTWTVLKSRARVTNRSVMWADLAPHHVVVASGPGGEREEVSGLDVDARDRIEFAPKAFLDMAPGNGDGDDGYAPDVIVVEPANSLSAVLDKKHFMLQEALIKPHEKCDAAVVDKLAERQRRELMHAMKFLTARYILYVTRSVQAEENEAVVYACLAAQADWRAVPLDDDEDDDEQEDQEVDPDHGLPQDRATASCCASSQPGSPPAATSPYLSIRPDPPRVTNGLFAALLERRSLSASTDADAVDDDPDCEEADPIEPTEPADPTNDPTPSPPPLKSSAKKKKKKVSVWRRQPVWRGAGKRAPWQPLPALAADSASAPAGLVVEGMSVATPATAFESDGAVMPKSVAGSTTSLNGAAVGKKRPAFPVPNPRPWK